MGDKISEQQWNEINNLVAKLHDDLDRLDILMDRAEDKPQAETYEMLYDTLVDMFVISRLKPIARILGLTDKDIYAVMHKTDRPEDEDEEDAEPEGEAPDTPAPTGDADALADLGKL